MGSKSSALCKDWVLSVSWKDATRWAWMATSTKCMISNPYMSIKGVSLISLFSVVLTNHSIAGSWSVYNCLASSNLFLGPFKICLLMDSTYPLVWGLAMAANLICIINTKISYLISVELPAIVEDHCLRHSKPSDDLFSYELLNLFSSYRCKCFCFHPFSEVINKHKEKLALPCCLWERTQNVHAPLCKREWRMHRCQWGRRLVA